MEIVVSFYRYHFNIVLFFVPRESASRSAGRASSDHRMDRPASRLEWASLWAAAQYLMEWD